MKKILIFIAFVFFILACNQNGTQSDDMNYADEEAIAPNQRMAVASAPPTNELAKINGSEGVEIDDSDFQSDANRPDKIEKKIIKDGRIGVSVDDLEASKSRVDSLVRSKKGFYANDRFDDSDYESSYVLKIRIPSSEFENFVAELGTYNGKINYKEINSRDVTSQFIDLETRLTNKRKYLEKYRDLLKSAKTVKDILQIENEIRKLEEEIESTIGQLNYLKDLVGYSTLDLVLTKKKDFKYEPEAQGSFIERLKESLSNGWKAGVNFVLILFALWPLWIILPVMIYMIRWIRKKNKKKE